MLELRAANFDDIEKEYEYITALPSDENGFTNVDFGVSRLDFETKVLPRYINHSNGLELPESYVPATEYFLWDGDKIVGLFRLRHKLNECLRNGAGHIGYGIKSEYRGRGYATKGLALVIAKAKEIIPEDEIYLSVLKSNPASLRVQCKNGAYIHHEDDTLFYTRVKK